MYTNVGMQNISVRVDLTMSEAVDGSLVEPVSPGSCANDGEMWGGA